MTEDDSPLMTFTEERMRQLLHGPAQRRVPSLSELTPQMALENLFGSDASPVDVKRPKELADLVVAFLQASGFRIIPEEDAEGDR
jgi:hypothetical protein